MEHQDILLARQPIYDANRVVVGYELLFRESNDSPISGFDGNRATSQVLLNLFTESDLATVTGGLPAFVNFTAELLKDPPLFDPHSIVIEILEDIDITDEIVASIKSLKQKGYTVALDDFVMEDRYKPLLDIIDIIKLELPEMNDDVLQHTIKILQPYNVILLAEKIETQEQFKRCRELGCQMFQGYFLSKPEVIKGTKLAANKLSIVRLISEINTPETNISNLITTITSDPALSFKLLKLINSAAYRRRKEIDSIHQAVVIFGIKKIKSWASLLALSNLDDKPKSLHHLALVRALMCEKLAENIAPEDKERFYTVGLLSCLDAFFDQNIKKILDDIALEQGIKNALLDFIGNAGLALKTTLYFEQSQWQKIDWDELARYKLSNKDINEIFYQCSQLALEMMND